MLHQFLTLNREEIVHRTRRKVALRSAPRPSQEQLEHGVPLFIDQLAETLRREQDSPARPTSSEMSRSAILHGSDLRRAGFTVAQVVHDYGDVCQAVTELAIEKHSPISTDEFKTLNRCLDEAIAQAVTEYARQRDMGVSEEATEKREILAHELGSLLATAVLTFEALNSGTIGVGGSTGLLLGRSLRAAQEIVRSLALRPAEGAP